MRSVRKKKIFVFRMHLMIFPLLWLLLLLPNEIRNKRVMLAALYYIAFICDMASDLYVVFFRASKRQRALIMKFMSFFLQNAASVNIFIYFSSYSRPPKSIKVQQSSEAQ